MPQVLNLLTERWDTFVLAVVLVVAVWRLGRRVGKWEGQIENALKGIKTLMASTKALVGALAKANVLDAEKLVDILGPYQDLSQESIDSLIRLRHNPMTPQEVTRLKELLEKAKDTKSLDYELARETYHLARMFAEEHPDDPDIQKIVEYAAYLLGSSFPKK